MSSYMNTIRILELRSLSRGVKPGNDAMKAGAGTKGVVVKPMENDDEASAVLTLDDFGGRSDALGG
jgi:hypothetical protein